MSGSRVAAATEWVELVSKVLLVVGTVVGAGWGLFEYWDHRHEGRTAVTLGYAQRFSEERLQNAMDRISAAWLAARDQLETLETASVRTPQEFEARRRQLVLTVLGRAGRLTKDGKIIRGLDGDVDAVLSFFDELHICVQERLCDDKTADAYFAGFARRFYCLNEPYIADKRAHYSKGYGDGMQTVALKDSGQCAAPQKKDG